MDIIIPTCKPRCELNSIVDTINKTTNNRHNIILTGFNASAATNRNYGLMRSTSEYVIMMDDDMTDFYNNWDLDLKQPFDEIENVIMVSPRLYNVDGTPGIMLDIMIDETQDYFNVIKRQLPTACIMFKKTGVRFDENYIGSGFEDNDFCIQMALSNQGGKFIIHNKCKLTHINEMKNQKGKYWQQNQKYFFSKWGRS